MIVDAHDINRVLLACLPLTMVGFIATVLFLVDILMYDKKSEYSDDTDNSWFRF